MGGQGGGGGGGARERDGGGGEGKVSTRLTSATARYTGTKYRYNNAVQVRVPVRLYVPVHTSTFKTAPYSPGMALVRALPLRRCGHDQPSLSAN